MPENRSAQVEDILANLPIFRQVAGAHLRELGRQTQLRRVAKGVVLFQRGDPATGCYALAYGQVMLSLRAPGGSEKVLRLVAAGESFAESSMFQQTAQPVTARTIADSLLVFVPSGAIFELLDSDPLFARSLLASLSQRIHTLIADIEAYSLNSGTERVAAYLFSLAGTSGPGPARVRLPANKSVIASRLGIAKETFSRLLHELAMRRLVEVRRREVLLLDPSRLAELARGAARS